MEIPVRFSLIPGRNPLRFIGGTLVECFEKLLVISVGGLCWGIFRCIPIEIRGGIVRLILLGIPRGFLGEIT